MSKSEFVVRRYAMENYEDMDKDLCDECAEDNYSVTERCSDGTPCDIANEDGDFYWIEDHDSTYDHDTTCDECGESRDSKKTYRLLWMPEYRTPYGYEVIEEEIEGEAEARYLQGEYEMAYGGEVRIEEED